MPAVTLEKKSRRGSVIAFIAVLAVLAAVVLLENVLDPNANIIVFTTLKKGAVYALVAVSMNLLNGFTGLFSLGQAGFMLLGGYTYAILTIPSAQRDSVYYLYDGSDINFSITETLQDLFGGSGVGGAVGLVLGVLIAIAAAGLVAAFIAWLIGLPVLKLKSDYLAIATLGFAEIIRAVFQWTELGRITNGANALKNYPTLSNFNITNADGQIVLRLSTFAAFAIAALCIWLIVLLINSSYGRAFKAIREDEVAAEAMGIDLARHKRMSFVISSFFAGVGGALLAMFMNQVQAKTFTSTMTYEILLIVVLGGIGSVSGSVFAAFLYTACSEWWLRFLDVATVFKSAGDRWTFIIVLAAAAVALTALLVWRRRRSGAKKLSEMWEVFVPGAIVLAYDIYYAIAGGMEVPFLRAGFRMVVFSVIIMVVVLFFRRGLFGDRELPYIVRRLGLYIRKVVKYREAATKKAAAEAKKEADGDE